MGKQVFNDFLFWNCLEFLSDILMTLIYWFMYVIFFYLLLVFMGCWLVIILCVCVWDWWLMVYFLSILWCTSSGLISWFIFYLLLLWISCLNMSYIFLSFFHFSCFRVYAFGSLLFVFVMEICGLDGVKY